MDFWYIKAFRFLTILNVLITILGSFILKEVYYQQRQYFHIIKMQNQVIDEMIKKQFLVSNKKTSYKTKPKKRIKRIKRKKRRKLKKLILTPKAWHNKPNGISRQSNRHNSIRTTKSKK